MAATREDADKASDNFLEKYQAKYPAAAECLAKDRDVLLTFYDFPAEHWRHLRTTNPIDSTFATIRLRHRRTQGSGSRKASFTMPDHSKSTLYFYGHACPTQGSCHVTFEQVAAYYGTLLPELQRAGDEVSRRLATLC